MKKFTCFVISLILVLAMAVPAFASSNVLQIDKNSATHTVSPTLYGVSLGNKNGVADSGLGANMVKNNSFEYTQNPMLGWSCSEKVIVSNQSPMNQNNPTYITVDVKGKGTLQNTGYAEKSDTDGAMAFKEGMSYIFSCYFQNISFDGSISASLNSKANSKNSINISTSEIATNRWNKVQIKIQSTANELGGLSINFNGKGKICVDYVCLVPEDSYGVGEDMWYNAQLNSQMVGAIKELKPSFIRFDASCASESDGNGNLFSWKDTIGPAEGRKQTLSIYDDYENGEAIINTNMVGYQEYFQLCVDLDAKAVPVVGAGIKCQTREHYDDYVNALNKTYMDDDQWKAYLKEELGIKGGAQKEYTAYINSLKIKTKADFDKYISSISLSSSSPEFKNYVQDILDLIEFANGDSQGTYWGSVRAQNGHEMPYNIEFIQVGNECWGEVYWQNFDAIKKAICEKYPSITVIASTGKSESGEYFDTASVNISSYDDVMAMEQYVATIKNPFDQNTSRYDGYDRSKGGVFADFRCASFDFGKDEGKNNLYSATQEAAFMVGLEQNSDAVKMASISPAIARFEQPASVQGLVWFDASDLVQTPDYYTQMLFANNLGTTFLESNLNIKSEKVFHSVTIDDNASSMYIKLVNTSGNRESLSVSLNGFDKISGVSTQSIEGSYKSAPNTFKKQAVAPVQRDLDYEKSSFELQLAPYSATVVRVALGENAQGFYTLGENINLEVKSYMPVSTKMLIVIMIVVFIFGTAGGYFAYSKIVLKGKKFKWEKQNRNNKNNPNEK